MFRRLGCMALVVLGLQCAPSEPTVDEPPALRLADQFTRSRLEGEPSRTPILEQLVWRFDELPEAEGGADEPDLEPEPGLTATNNVEAFHDVEDLRVEDGVLLGTTGAIPVLRLAVDPIDRTGSLHSVQFRIAVSAGTTLGMFLSDEADLDREDATDRVRRSTFWMLSADVEAGDEFRTVTIDMSHVPTNRLGDIRHVFFQPTDASGATFAIEEIRFVTRAEHLAQIPSGISWQGLAEIYRETLVLRAPQSATFDISLPTHPWIDLAIGTIEPQPVTFHVSARTTGGDEIPLLRRTITTPDRWETVPLELDELAGQAVALTFRVEAEMPGTIGFFGTPVIRNSGASPRTEAGPLADAPRGVILILADTLRRDHLDMYGYERDTAPTLTRLAGEGALFTDNVSQGTWTKVSVPSILTSLYPTSHGLVDARDRLPSTVTTLAEVYQQAGYATFATSSVFFTGKLSNLQQGIDVLNERSSVGDLDHSRSKTARTFVDRLTAWMEERREGPFFAFLHVFDAHDPFPPYAPYDELWSEDGASDAHEEAVETVKEWQKENGKEEEGMPRKSELLEAGVSADEFVAREIDWYDESIRGMDTEIARLIERIEEMGLANDVLIAFISDHGEEFLEHGRHFHGNTTYGEMTSVPLFLWGPRWVPPGTVVERTVQSLDLMPTLLDLSGLTVPDEAQGQSLVPLLGGDGDWTQRPAISERRRASFDREPEPDDVESFSLVHEGYRLIHNVTRPDDMPEFELYDHTADPLNSHDIAGEHPGIVAKLSGMLETWRMWAESARIDGGEVSDLTPAELAELRALGYVK